MPPLVAPELDAPPLRRHGLPEYVKGASPAAGADFVQELGGDFHTRLVSLHCRLVTSADVANREVVLEYRDDEDNRYHVNGAPLTVLASDTIDFVFSAFITESAWEVDSTVLVPLAPILLPPTHDFRVHVVSMDNTDQLSRIRFVWERFYSSPTE